MVLKTKLFGKVYQFKSILDVLAKAGPLKSGDQLMKTGAETEVERTAAKAVLAEMTIADLRNHPAVPYEEDEVTRVIQDDVNEPIYNQIKNWTIGELREYILDRKNSGAQILHISRGITAEVAAAVGKLMTNMDLVYAARKIRVITTCNTTLGHRGILGSRLQPNHPSDDTEGIRLSVLEGLSYGIGDVCIGINPVSDTIESTTRNLNMLHEVKESLQIPTQTVMLSHITTQMECLRRGVPMDLIFESIGGTEKCNNTFGVNKALLEEAAEMLRTKGTATGPNLLYFETGQGPETVNGTHCGVDQVTLEARTLGYGKHFKPFCMNTITGFIGPEVEYNSCQSIRAGLENHFMGKLMGCPLGIDSSYASHVQGEFSDIDTLVMCASLAGTNYWVGVPGGSECMVAAIEPSFHDIATVRDICGLHPVKEFEDWCKKWGILDSEGHLTEIAGDASIFM
ncbi:MAG: ethanolamine ammonia-lyase subunit EutB [Pseudoflavonifractor sp.]|nr:ethanolamine ammonia-lyase subunit EutB [Pseudoflavonifractor sp.]